jgi:large conductance mechanosensitive channel
MKKLFADFKKFITRGNVIDMAVGVIIGSAFSTIVTSLTNKIIMPLINALLAGGKGLESAYTFLKEVRLEDGSIDLANSIYIDWGAFITAIINFLLIAIVLFTIIKVVSKSREVLENLSKTVSKKTLSRDERKILKARGVDIKNREVALVEIEKYYTEEKEKAEQEAKANYKPTDNELLVEIRDLLKKQIKE